MVITLRTVIGMDRKCTLFNTVATIVTCNFETINATILTSLRENKFLERANYTINQSARRTHSSRSIIKKGNKYFLRHFTMIIQN